MFRWLHPLASPPRLHRIAGHLLPWTLVAWALTFAIGLYWSLLIAPPDYQQGEGYRIIFVHVPAAWMSLFTYTAMTLVALIGLIWQFKIAPLFIRVAAPLGALYTALTLATGAIWGKPMWGSWWVWDARLTSELILLFLYLGCIALNALLTDTKGGDKIIAILLLVGSINIPIIHFSVEWWNTLHQPASILKFGKPSIHPTMLAPLLLMALSFKLHFTAAILLAIRTEIHRRGWTSRQKT